MQLSNAVVGFIIAVALAVLAASGWVIFSRQPAPAPEAAAPATPTPAPSAASAIPTETDEQRLERQRDEALMEAQRAREALALERQAREADAARAEETARQAGMQAQARAQARQQQAAIPTIAGRWQGQYVLQQPVVVAIEFAPSGQFASLTHGGDRGLWRQQGTEIVWQNQNGVTFQARLIRPNLMQGVIRRQTGEFIGEFRLARVG